MDLDSFLVAVDVMVDEWWQDQEAPAARRPGRATVLSESAVLTLALVAQWPRWRSARDCWRCAHAPLRPSFPALGAQSPFKRRVRAAEPALRALHAALAALLEGPHAAYHGRDTTLLPAGVRVRACRQGLCAGQASCGRCVAKTERVYGFQVALAGTPAGLSTAFGLAPAAGAERPSGNALLAAAGHDASLADKG